jgi:ABC-type multidrug transport system permease subunit
LTVRRRHGAAGRWRWLLVKDLKILRRSPLLVSVLVLYPVAVALLVGLALSRGPDKPTIAIVNDIPKEEKLQIGNERFDLLSARSAAFEHVNVVNASSRRKAIDDVRSGKALGALVIPPDTVSKLGSQLERPRIELVVNERDPLKARLVDDTVTSLLATANQRLSRAFTRVNLSYLALILHGGPVTVFGTRFDVLGLEKVERIATAARRRLPRAAPERRGLARVARFSRLAQQNLDLTRNVLAAVREPITVTKNAISGPTVPLTTFAAAIAVALSLMFVAVLLAAGSLALERSENAFERLVRGPVTRRGLLAEKVALAAGCSLLVTLVMLLGLGVFIPLDWGRIGLWLVALAVAASAFAAMGTAIGGVAKEVSVASLLAFALLLPVAFLALVPSGVVSATLYDVSRVVSALFPFKATLDAMSSALYGKGALAAPLLHLVALAAGFAVASRLALSRFG